MSLFPNKKYDIIYADPPWEYNNGTAMSSGSQPRNYYPTMPLPELKALPISDIVEDNCLLYLWVVSLALDQGIELGVAWGFKYATIGFVWDKQLPVTGYHTMSQCEICLIFKRGKIPQPRGARNVKQFLSSKRGSHSEKPWQIRDAISKMFPTQLKIELFARRNASLIDEFSGWDIWGNEASK